MPVVDGLALPSNFVFPVFVFQMLLVGPVGLFLTGARLVQGVVDSGRGGLLGFSVALHNVGQS